MTVIPPQRRQRYGALSRTPGPAPPAAGMNSIPASSKVRTSAASDALLGDEVPASKPTMAVSPTSHFAASSLWLQFKNARAARLWPGVIMPDSLPKRKNLRLVFFRLE